MKVIYSMNKPFFSVIIPVYKVEDYLHQCVNSVLAQDFEDFEIILVDDGSPDNCPQICGEYAAKDHRVKVIHKKNGGLSDARNYGIEVAEGEYLLFLDSDDYWMDVNFLSELIEVINITPTVIVINFGWTKLYQLSNQFIEDKRHYSFNREGESKRDYISKLIEKDLFIASACNKCIKRQFVIENQLFFQKGIKSEDMDWCGRILFSMPSMLCYNSKSYIYRQQVSGSITSNVNLVHISNIVHMIKNALEKSKNLGKQESEIFLSFYAVQYLTLLFNIHVAKEQNATDLLREVFVLRKILENNLNYKVKRANMILKIFGYSFMTRALRLYVLNSKK